jgi:beta-catenin-like protein 1
MASIPKCSSCGGWGKGLVSKTDGLCDHCRKNPKAQSVAAIGQKRPRPADFDAERSIDATLQPTQLSAAELQALLAQADAVDAPELDTAGVKKMLFQFEKRINVNMQQRAKHSEDAKGYLQSEIWLDTAIKQLQVLAAVPEHYHTLVASGSVTSLLGLLAHENTDIAIDVLQLLSELCRDDSVSDAPEAGHALSTSILSNGGAELLVAGLCRLNDDAEAQDVVGMLAGCELFLSLAEITGGDGCLTLGSVVAKTGGTQVGPTNVSKGTPLLLSLLMARVARKEMDDVKGLCAELLAVLLSSSGALCLVLGGWTGFSYTRTKGQGQPVVVDGIEYLLHLVNSYKKKGPDALPSDEREVVENVMDALASALVRNLVLSTFYPPEPTST